MEIDKKIIKKLVEVLEDLKKSLKEEIVINNDNPAEEEIEISSAVVKSPIVGTAYLASEPGAKPFVSIGKKIKKGETVMIVEAMKTMNHVLLCLMVLLKKFVLKMANQLNMTKSLLFLNNV